MNFDYFFFGGGGVMLYDISDLSYCIKIVIKNNSIINLVLLSVTKFTAHVNLEGKYVRYLTVFVWV